MSTLILISSHTEEDQVESTRFMLQEEGDVEVSDSQQEYDRSFPLYGTWEGWINHVSGGVDYLSRLPVYSKFIAVDTQLGKANASIIEKALDAGKECLYFDGRGFTGILSVHQIGDNWSDGWEIVTL